MFINESILKGNTKKKTTQRAKPSKANERTLKAKPRQHEQSPQQPQSDSFLGGGEEHKQSPLTQLEFEKILKFNLKELMQQWKGSLAQLQTQLQGFKNIEETESQEQAFDQCVYLIEQEFLKDESDHKESMHLIDKKIFQVDDYKLRLKKELEILHNEISKLAEANTEMDRNAQKIKHKRKDKTAIINQIKHEAAKKNQIQLKIQECREKSHDQKNQYLQAQEEEYRLLEQIENLEEEEQGYNQNLQRQARYHKLQQIRDKILNNRSEVENEILPHLQRKISKMAHLRSDLKEIQDALEISRAKTEDQSFIIAALKEKVHMAEYQTVEEDNYSMFKKKYDQIYLSKDPNGNWKDYKEYIKHLTQRNKRRNSRVFTQGAMSVNLPLPQGIDIERQKKPYNSRNDSRQVFPASTKNINTKKMSHQILEGDSKVTKLPRLAKDQKTPEETRKHSIQQKRNHAKKIGNKHRHDSSQLDEMESDTSEVSGELIHVDFHKKSKP